MEKHMSKMQTSRRGFLGAALALVPVAALAGNQHAEAPTEYRGYRISWSGWKGIANQNVQVGAWYAEKSRGDWWYSTTLGAVRRARGPFEQMDMTLVEGMPIVRHTTRDADKEPVKQLALRRLLRSLDTGKPSYVVEYAMNTTRPEDAR